MRAVVVEREPGEAAAHAAVPARRRRARQRGEEERAVAAGRRQRGEREQLACWMPCVAAHQRVLPPETKPGFSTSSMPSTACAWVSSSRCSSSDRLARRDGDRLGGAGDVDDHARLQRSRADRAGVVVAGADDHAAAAGSDRALRQPRARSVPITASAGWIAGRLRRLEAGVRDQLVAPARGGRGRRAASRRRWRDPARPRRSASRSCARPPGPASGRRGSARAPMSRSHIALGAVCEASGFRPVRVTSAGLADGRAERLGLLGRAAVEPDDRGAQRAQLCVERDQAVDLAGEAEHRDVVACRSRPGRPRRGRRGRAPSSSRRGPARPSRRRGVAHRVQARSRWRARVPASSATTAFTLCEPTSTPITQGHQTSSLPSRVPGCARARAAGSRPATARRPRPARPRSRSPTGTTCTAAPSARAIWPTSSATISAAPPIGRTPWRIRWKRPERGEVARGGEVGEDVDGEDPERQQEAEVAVDVRAAGGIAEAAAERADGERGDDGEHAGGEDRRATGVWRLGSMYASVFGSRPSRPIVLRIRTMPFDGVDHHREHARDRGDDHRPLHPARVGGREVVPGRGRAVDRVHGRRRRGR